MAHQGKRIIVDIDNTLWDLSPVLWEYLRVVNPGIPGPTEWNDWNFWGRYVTLKEIYQVLETIHLKQDQYPPYPESRDFLEALKERDFQIVIASHREKQTYAATLKWLKQNGLPFDEIHLSHDKSVLFPGSWGIVDDSPETLQKAASAGIVRTGLLNPWNAESAHPLFSSLTETLSYIDSIGGKGRDEKVLQKSKA